MPQVDAGFRSAEFVLNTTGKVGGENNACVEGKGESGIITHGAPYVMLGVTGTNSHGEYKGNYVSMDLDTAEEYANAILKQVELMRTLPTAVVKRALIERVRQMSHYPGYITEDDLPCQQTQQDFNIWPDYGYGAMPPSPWDDPGDYPDDDNGRWPF